MACRRGPFARRVGALRVLSARLGPPAARDAFLTVTADGDDAIDAANLAAHIAAIEALLRRSGDRGDARPSA